MLLPNVLKFNSPKVTDKVNTIFNKLNFEDGYSDIQRLVSDIGLSARLTDYGYKEDHLETIINGTLGSAQAPTNPRIPINDDIIGIVKEII